MKRVLALQQVWDDPPGVLGTIMEAYDIACDVVKVEEAPIPDLSGYDALIALGGPQNADEDDIHPYLTEEKSLLRRAVAQDIPFLGMCLGGQLLARALDAPVTRRHYAEIGFFEVQLTEEGRRDPLFDGLPGYQQALHWHEDTFGIPAGAVRLATSDGAKNQAFRFGRRAYCLQYHIELTPSMLDTWLRYPEYKQELIRIAGPDAPERIEKERAQRYPIYREHTRIVFENFLRISGCI
ncbi:MAG TPA: type 1 glutamine amidotransferase [Ktedonobacteraceae bacterium]|nr:type 1 glutamine amidotransferase [Ktedonobacteraceae bacterium]